ncbi:MAG: hypothetical protein AAB604_03410 [Patescibacteria group bacterium]|jgi:hypothetical protein
MASRILEKIFASPLLIRAIRFFYLNPNVIFLREEIRERIGGDAMRLRQAITVLTNIGFLKKKTISIAKKEIKKHRVKKEGYLLNRAFPLFQELKDLVLSPSPISKPELVRDLKQLGRVKLLLLSGVFIRSDDQRVDLFVVADGIKPHLFERLMRRLEAEIGKELNYSLMTTRDFMYRFNLSDRFIREMFDTPHEILINKLDNVP